jgi:ribosome-associated toxin RatA of RatAB toxin-antitoxin module
MKEISRSALLPFSAKQMFDVVNDVESYQDYLPSCSRSEVIESSPEFMVARLTLTKAGVSQQFTTRNNLVGLERIDLQLVDGPFTSLNGFWLFSQLGNDGCKTEMNLAFDFNSRMLNATFGKVFEQVADSLVEAFCDRAKVLYSND